MARTWRDCLRKSPLARVVFGVATASLSACINLGTTTFVRIPSTYISNPEERAFELMTPSCLSVETITRLLDKDDDLRALSVTYNTQARGALMELITSVLKVEQADCPQDAKKLWNTIRTDLVKDNQGLILDRDYSSGEFNRTLESAVGHRNQVSVSMTAPGALSLSARPLPADQEPGGVFAGLKERAQAAVIGYAQAYVKSDKSQDEDRKKSPEDAANALLKSLSPAREPRIAETQRVEFTISAAVNSASVDDRFEYITAYLKLPALPGRLNGRVSLERIFLFRFQGLTFGRPEYQRMACEMGNGLRQAVERTCVEKTVWERLAKTDIRRALDSIRVRIEVIDPLDTKAATVELGKLTSQAGLGLEGAQTVIGELSLTRIAPSISASREDTLKRELDRRTAWISPERSLLRITQRGLREATISGTISNALTLKIPKTSLYMLSIVEEETSKKKIGATTKKSKPTEKAKSDNAEEKIKKVKLQNAEQPLYGTVDAFGIALGTVRVAIPSAYPFRKELDGVSTTVVGEPVILRLWRHDRGVVTLDFQDLNPQLRGMRDGTRALGIYSEVPSVRQLAVFPGDEQWGEFMKDLTSANLQLREHPSSEKKGWFVIAGRDICDLKIGEPGAKEVFLGIENEEGLVQPFSVDQSKHLSRFIAQCK